MDIHEHARDKLHIMDTSPSYTYGKLIHFLRELRCISNETFNDAYFNIPDYILDMEG